MEFGNRLLENNSQSTQKNYDDFCAFIQDLLNSLPHGFTRSRTDLPWLSRDLKRKCAKKRRLYNRAKKSSKSRHDHHWGIYKAFADVLKKELRQAHWKHVNKILLAAEEEKNPKPFWNYVKSQSQDNVGVAPLKSEDKLHTEAADKARILSSQFKSVFTKDNDPASKNTAPSGPSYPPMEKFSITEVGV